MELKVDIGFDKLLSAIKHLPENQLALLQAEISKKKRTPIKNKDFKEFLLKGPVMSDEHFEEFKKTRKRINQWMSK